jgi:alpha-glucosidase
MSRTGLPIVRPLFLEFPQGALDQEPLDLSDSGSFLLGSDLLVAQSPVPDEVDEYSVALPPVGWYDYWTGARVEGGTGRKAIDNTEVVQPEVHLHNSIATLPVFVRAGAIVPQQPLVQSTDEKPRGPLTLRVYPPTAPDKECAGSVYLDDGVSYDFRNGDFLRVGFTCKLAAHGLEVTVAPHQGSFAPWWSQLSVEVYGASRPAVKATTSTSTGSRASAVLTKFDAEHHRISAVLPDDGKGIKLDLNY